MTDIFVSYPSKHCDLTETLATTLESDCYDAARDNALQAYASFGKQLDAVLSHRTRFGRALIIAAGLQIIWPEAYPRPWPWVVKRKKVLITPIVRSFYSNAGPELV